MKIDGMVGYQFLARFLTTIDYANSQPRRSRCRASAPLSAPGAAPIAFYIDGTIPAFPIGVDGVTTTAEVDTGNRAGLELSSPFLATHPAIASLAKTAPRPSDLGSAAPRTPTRADTDASDRPVHRLQ